MDPALCFFQEIIEDEISTSSDSDEEMVFEICTAACNVYTKALASEIVPIQHTDKYISVTIENFSDEAFQQNFRITREAFYWLEKKLTDSLKNRSYGPDQLEPKKQILPVIWILSTPDSYRSIAGRFDMSKSTLHKCFERVIQALVEIAPQIIKWPKPEERKVIKDDFFKWGKIPGVVGAIDGTYIPIKAPQENPEAYINRKCFHAITMQAICDHSRAFRDIFVGFPSSVGDLRIFRNSDIYRQISLNVEEHFSANEFIIGDKAYPLLTWCIPPYIDRGNLTRKEINFNNKHANTRQVVERAFALLFGRFRRLKYLDMSKTKLVPNVVLAACVLHNICLMFNDKCDSIFEETLGVEQVYQPVGDAANILRNEPLHREAVDLRNSITNGLEI